MDVFISWSGERSRAAAEALRGWLPKIINAFKPWLSSADIDKGARWGTDVASRLESARAGIICLTPSNLHSDWILFEAGALSKTLQNTFVCPLLIGLEPSDVKPPLAQFQATKASRTDILKLLKTLNSALGKDALPETHIDEAFEVWWPKLEHQFKALPADNSSTAPHRPDRELIEEILALVRSQNRRVEQEEEPDEFDPRLSEIWNAIESVDPAIEMLSLPTDGKYSVTTTDNRKYTVVVAENVPLANIEGVVRPQVLKALKPS